MIRRFFQAIALVLFTAVALLPAGCGTNPTTSNAPVVRVLIFESAPRLTLTTSQTPVATIGSDNNRRKINFPAGTTIPLDLTGNSWHAGNAVLGSGELILEPSSVGSISIDGLSFRGRYRFVPVGPDHFDVINDVDVDSYLKGVVAAEMFPAWEEQAFRAQAVVARTYALYEAQNVKLSNPNRHWDVYSDTRSQVYGGLRSETSKSRDAVDRTAGVVVAYGEPGRERIFKAYFSSCCGGIGQSAYDAFGDPYIPALGEKSVGTLCSASPKYSWMVSINKEELTRRIRGWGTNKNRPEKNMAMLARIDVAAVNRLGRPVQFFFTDVTGNRYSLGSEETRWAINYAANGGPTVNSSYIKPNNEAAVIRFEGHGYGHGVGLCQWCAEAQALQGMAYEKIVLSAFPGSKLRVAY